MKLELPGDKVQHYVFINSGKGPRRLFTHSIHTREQVPRIKGLRRGMSRSHGKVIHKGNKVSGKKSLHIVTRCASWGAVPFFDSPTASFSLFDRRDA